MQTTAEPRLTAEGRHQLVVGKLQQPLRTAASEVDTESLKAAAGLFEGDDIRESVAVEVVLDAASVVCGCGSRSGLGKKKKTDDRSKQLKQVQFSRGDADEW
jgi:hypothetical protein